MPKIKISQHLWEDAPANIAYIRRTVFIEEQSVPEELEWDELDEKSLHFLVEVDGAAAGTARLIIEDETVKIGRMAILPEYRNKTLGSLLVKHMVKVAAHKGLHILKLSAQTHAVPFYKKLGFFSVGDIYDDAGIDHIDMENPAIGLTIDEKFKTMLSEGKHPKSKADFELNVDPRSHIFTQTRQLQDLSKAMIGQARRRVCIVSQNLDRDLFDNEYICDAIHRVVKNDSQAEIKIWVQDDKITVGKYHRLINLAQRLTSYVEIRFQDRGRSSFLESMVLVDFNACIHLRNHKVHAGFANFNNRMIAERLYRVFDEHWQVAKPTMEMRRLAI